MSIFINAIRLPTNEFKLFLEKYHRDKKNNKTKTINKICTIDDMAYDSYLESCKFTKYFGVCCFDSNTNPFKPVPIEINEDDETRWDYYDSLYDPSHIDNQYLYELEDNDEVEDINNFDDEYQSSEDDPDYETYNEAW